MDENDLAENGRSKAVYVVKIVSNLSKGLKNATVADTRT